MSAVQSKIYRIFSTKGNKVYVGSTTQELHRRMARHCDKDRSYMSRLLFDEYGVEFCHIELIENVEQDQRLVRERFHIENTPNCVNKKMPIRTDDEKEDSKEKDKERKKAWALAKKEEDPETFNRRACEIQKAYYQRNREEMLEKAKEYAKQNVEQKKEYMAKYHEAYKETDKYKAKNDRLKEKVPCDQCDQIMMRANLARHKKKHHPVE